MCEKAVNTYLSTINIVSECFMTQEMCDKAVNGFVFFFYSVLFRISIKLKKFVIELFLIFFFFFFFESTLP